MRRHLAMAAAATTAAAALVLQAGTATAAPAATSAGSPGSLGQVSSAHVVRVSSTVATLAWTNPHGSGGTFVRYARGTHAPRTRTSGHDGGRVVRGHRMVTLHDLTAGTRYAVSLFAEDGHGHLAARRTLQLTTAPGPVTSVIAYDQGSGALITWTLPRTRTLHRVIARYALGGIAPASIHSGHGIGLAHDQSHSAVLTHLARETRYSVSVFTLDRAGRTSTPAITRFVTLPDPAHDGALTGRVTDTAGHPLRGAEITAENFTTPDLVTTTSGADGRWSLTGPAGDWDVDIDGQNITGGTSDASGYLPGETYGHVSAGRTSATGSAALRPGAAVSGRIVDPSGQPVIGTPVDTLAVSAYAHADDEDGGGLGFDLGGDDGSSPVTDATGHYVIRGLAAGQAVQVCGGAGATTPGTCGHSSVLPAISRVVAAKDVTITPLTGGGTIHGSVTAGGRASADAAVDIVPTSQDIPYLATVQTDERGSFTVDHLPAGRYFACVDSTHGGATGYVGTCAAVVVRAAVTSTVALAQHAGAGITGLLTGPGGRPVPGDQVEAVRTFDDGTGDGTDSVDIGTTDSHGHFHLVGLPGGPIRICAAPVDYTPTFRTGLRATCSRSIAVRTGLTRSDATVALSTGGVIEGRVRDHDGHPLAGAPVLLFDTSGGGSDENDFAYEPGVTFTDEDGYYFLGGVDPVPYGICAIDIARNGQGTCLPRTAEARPGHVTTANVTVSAAAATGISVSVTDADGTPIAGVDVAVVGACPADSDDCDAETVDLLAPGAQAAVYGQSVTDASGRTEIDGLAPGSYAVCLFAYYGTTASGGSPTGYADQCDGSTFDLRVRTGQVVHVLQALAPGGVVTGHVTDGGGRAVGNARLTVSGSAAADYPGSEDDGTQPPDPDNPTPGPAQQQVTDSDGSYTVLGVQPGKQSVCVDATYATGRSSAGGYLGQCLGASAASPKGTPVTVATGEVTTAPDIALSPASRITGTVTDPQGHRLSEAEVVVFTGRTYSRTSGVADDEFTGDDGTWSSIALPAGTYTVCALSPAQSDTGSVYYGQCWKNVRWDVDRTEPPLAKATLITTTAGQAVGGIDLALAMRK